MPFSDQVVLSKEAVSGRVAGAVTVGVVVVVVRVDGGGWSGGSERSSIFRFTTRSEGLDPYA